MAYTIGALTLTPGAAAAIAAKGQQLRPGTLAPRAVLPKADGGDGDDKGMSPGMIAAGVVAIAALAYVATR